MQCGFVAFVLFMIWGVLLLRHARGTPEWLALIFAILPVVLTATIASTGIAFGRFRPFWEHTRGMVQSNTFIATRPIATGRLVAAKFLMAAQTVLVNWTLAVVGTIGWLIVSDNLDVAAILVRRFFGLYPGARGVAIIVLICILLPALSWRLVTESIAPVLYGRRWLSDATASLYVAFMAAFGGFALWLAKSEPHQVARLYAAMPLVVVGIALVKGGAAVAGFRAVIKRRLLSWWNVAGVFGLWFALTACGIALALLLGSSPSSPVSLPILALSVAALVPMARFPLATIALDWNRHR